MTVARGLLWTARNRAVIEAARQNDRAGLEPVPSTTRSVR
jgi:hypothetical protein